MERVAKIVENEDKGEDIDEDFSRPFNGVGFLGFHGVGPCSEILGPIPKRKGSFQIGVRNYFGF